MVLESMWQQELKKHLEVTGLGTSSTPAAVAMDVYGGASSNPIDGAEIGGGCILDEVNWRKLG